MTKFLSSHLRFWENRARHISESVTSELRDEMVPQPKYVAIADLPEEEAETALNAFAELADNQRGHPEDMGGAGRMGANKGLDNATGVYTYLTEHIGDLTHRMAQRRCERFSFGYDLVLPKVDRGLRFLTSPYGFEREVMENIQANLEYRVETGLAPPSTKYEDLVQQWKKATHRYAEAHAELIVYNDAQWNARQAAIELGNRNWNKAIAALNTLKEHLSSPESWVAYAGVVVMSGGRPIPR